MKRLSLVIAVFMCFSGYAQESLNNTAVSSFEETTRSDTSIESRFMALEKRLLLQDKKIKSLQNENAQLKQQVAELNTTTKEKKKRRKYVVSRTGSKQLILDTSSGTKETHDAVRWESLRR